LPTRSAYQVGLVGPTIRATQYDRARADDLCSLDEDELIVTDAALHDLVCVSEAGRLEALVAVQVGERREQRRTRRFCDPAQVLLPAPAHGHRARLDKLLQAQIVDALCRKDDVRAGLEDFANALERDVGLSAGSFDKSPGRSAVTTREPGKQ
jgi:hypothetical protein